MDEGAPQARVVTDADADAACTLVLQHIRGRYKELAEEWKRVSRPPLFVDPVTTTAATTTTTEAAAAGKPPSISKPVHAFHGIHQKATGRWEPQIRRLGRIWSLGSFATPEHAARVWDLGHMWLRWNNQETLPKKKLNFNASTHHAHTQMIQETKNWQDFVLKLRKIQFV